MGNFSGLREFVSRLISNHGTPSSENWRDAYEGAREDLLDWKRRALTAEAKLGKSPADHPPPPVKSLFQEMQEMGQERDAG